jgi:hypothetical protein
VGGAADESRVDRLVNLSWRRLLVGIIKRRAGRIQ